MCKIGTDIQQCRDGFSGTCHRIFLECLAHLIEQHNENSLCHFPQIQRANRREGHQEVFIKNLPLSNMLHRTQQNIIPENQICADIKNRADRSLMQENSRKEERKPYAKPQEKFSAEHILIPMRMVMSTATATGTAIVIIVILLTATAAMLMMRMMMLCLLPLQKGNLYLRLKFMHHPFHRFLHFLCRSIWRKLYCHFLPQQIDGNLLRFRKLRKRILNLSRTVRAGQPF